MKYASLLGHTVEILVALRRSPLPADAVIGQFFRSRKYLGSRDRRFIAETAYGTLRHQERCDESLRRIGVAPSSATAEGRALLQALTYLLTIEGRGDIEREDLAELLSDGEASAEADGIAKVMDQLQSEPPDVTTMEPAQRYSFPAWMVKRLQAEYGAGEAEQIMAALNDPPTLTVRANLLKGTVEEARNRLETEGLPTTPGRYAPAALHLSKRVNLFGLNAFKEGWIEVQDEGSQLLPLLVDPKPTSKVLDACAGAGGKTLAFAALMKNRGEIVASDVHAYRLEELRRRARRAGAFNIRVQQAEHTSDLLAQHPARFDVVFVDAPCSGLGTIRRNPGMKWTVTERTVEELSTKQQDILAQASPLVKPGGVLVYATCTMLAAENESVVGRFLAAMPSFSPEPPRKRLEELGIEDGLSGDFVKLLPQRHGTDGFFAAFLRKAPTS
ncbi:MAG: methyltransferase domain-containing protein [Bacteroidetes bacterium]|jgi:16S rRNA (cytosine967-C5)-methyltransferase|nr:methyltransferase domain-containing protein [Bacteroidota bacterium]